ncbi:hypothetical protein PFISCL1PPCAC_3794, partial [Pristionchus fissidentatus]
QHLQQLQHSQQVIGSGERTPTNLPPQSCDVVKCTSEPSSTPSFLPSPVSASSIYNDAADSSREDASGDESDGEEPAHSDSLNKKSKQQFELKEARKRIAAEGAAPSSATAFASLEQYLLSRSNVKSSLAPLSISLFNFHSTIFAQRLIDRSVGSLVLVESALEHAMKAKDFGRAARRKGRRVEAVHADPAALFGLDRRKKEEKDKERRWRKKKTTSPYSFPDQLVARPNEDSEDGAMMPLKLRRSQSRSPTTVISPIIICPLGLQTQHVAVLDAILCSLLLHHLGVDERGIYAMGDVELLTYLHSEQMAHLLSSSTSALSFVSHATKRRSQLMNKLFHIGHLKKTLSSDSFSPPNLPPSKKMAHAKKMKEEGFSSSRWFAATIRPRSTVVIAGREVVPGEEVHDNDRLADLSPTPCLPLSVLAPYAYWCEALGKVLATKKAGEVMSMLIPGSASVAQSIIPSSARIGEATVDDVDAVFVEALTELRECANFKQFKAKNLTKSDGKHEFAD